VKTLRSARLYYAASLFISLTAAAILGGPVAYGMTSALIAAAAAAAFLSWRCKRQMLIRHALDNDVCIRGGEVKYAIEMRNRGAVPQTWAMLELSSTRGVAGESFEITMKPFGVSRHITEICPPHRGIYVLTVAGAFISDPFRLTKLNARRPNPLTLTVYPRILPISEAWKQRLDPQGRGGVFSQSSDEPAVDSRAYRYGDSRRRIHWNLTARRRELMVRQYESVESRRLTVILDLSPFKADNPDACEDTLIESCLSVVRCALERRIETTLAYAAGGCIHRHTGSDIRIFDEIHHQLASAEFSADIPLIHLLDGAEQAQMIFLFCAESPGGDVLSALPQDIPVELAVVRTHDEARPLPESVASLRVTELIP
jgi:uncharacterized protein (DUF58 family)